MAPSAPGPGHVPALLAQHPWGTVSGDGDLGRSRMSPRLAPCATWQVPKQLGEDNAFFCQFSNLSNEQENKSS